MDGIQEPNQQHYSGGGGKEGRKKERWTLDFYIIIQKGRKKTTRKL